MPRAHQEYASLTPEKMQKWAESIGPSTSLIVTSILKDAPHPEIGCKRIHGFLNLSKMYSKAQLEMACTYALSEGINKYQYIEIIIKQQIPKQPFISAIPSHDNIRGEAQYH